MLTLHYILSCGKLWTLTTPHISELLIPIFDPLMGQPVHLYKCLWSVSLFSTTTDCRQHRLNNIPLLRIKETFKWAFLYSVQKTGQRQNKPCHPILSTRYRSQWQYSLPGTSHTGRKGGGRARSPRWPRLSSRLWSSPRTQTGGAWPWLGELKVLLSGILCGVVDEHGMVTQKSQTICIWSFGLNVLYASLCV